MSNKKLFPWQNWPKEKLLNLRLCDLGLKIEDTWLEPMLNQLYKELDQKKIKFKPHVWLSHDWFCPDGCPGFAIPFYLAHPKLIKLERNQMLEAEGDKKLWCMKLLRHETGHAIQNAYRLHYKPGWRAIFGHASTSYPDEYHPKPMSKNYVLHLYMWYAQSHPVEDFAETFAVWLKPKNNWRNTYEGWPALQKLTYIDDLMENLAGTTPILRSKKQYDPLKELKITLGEYYTDKRQRYGGSFPTLYDGDLLKLFTESKGNSNTGEAASAFLRKHRKSIRNTVTKWTGDHAFSVDAVLRDMIGRTKELKLRAIGDPNQLKLEFAVLLSVRTIQFLQSGTGRIIV